MNTRIYVVEDNRAPDLSGAAGIVAAIKGAVPQVDAATVLDIVRATINMYAVAPRLVRHTSRAAAERYVQKDTIVAHIASQDDLEKLLKTTNVEDGTATPEPIDGAPADAAATNAPAATQEHEIAEAEPAGSYDTKLAEIADAVAGAARVTFSDDTPPSAQDPNTIPMTFAEIHRQRVAAEAGREAHAAGGASA